MSKTPIEVGGIITTARRAVTSAPSYSMCLAAQENLRRLADKRESAKTELSNLSKLVPRDILEAQARAMREGKPIPQDSTTESVIYAQRQLRVIEEAEAQESRELDTLRTKLVIEVSKALRDLQRPAVARIAAAITELLAAAAEEDVIMQEFARAGVDTLRLNRIAFAGAAPGCGFHEIWLEQRRAEGFAV